MGSADGAETCELIGTFLLNQLNRIIPKHEIGIYRDDGLAIVRKNPKEAERIKTELFRKFNEYGLEITAEANATKVDYLDVKFDIKTKIYKPYTKPSNKHLYVHQESNHPPLITKQIPQSIEARLSNISSNEAIFKVSKAEYKAALKEAGYNTTLHYIPTHSTNNRQERKRKWHFVWFTPPLIAM